MSDFPLTTRETALLILFVLLGSIALFVTLRNKTRRSYFKNLIRAALNPLLSIALISIILVTFFGIALAQHITVPFLGQLWSYSLFKDTVLEFLFVGIPATFRGIHAHTIRGAVRRIVLPEISFSAALQFYLNLETFSLPIELTLQLTLLLIALISAFGRNDAHKLSAICSSLNMIIGIFVLFGSTFLIINNFFFIDWVNQAKSLLMSLWYPMLLVPAIYLMILHDAVVKAKRVSTLVLNSKPRTLFAIVFLLPDVKALTFFPGPFRDEVSKAHIPMQLLTAINRYKKWVRARVATEREKLYRRDHGSNSVNSAGIWQNRAGSKEVKDYLINIATLQSATWKSGLPKFCNLISFPYRQPKEASWAMCIPSKTGHAWYAFASTESELCYGIKVIRGDRQLGFYESLGKRQIVEDPDEIVFLDKAVCPNWSYDDDINMAFLD